MVSDAVEFSTNQKTVNFFRIFNDISVTNKEFLVAIFCIAFRKIFQILQQSFCQSDPPLML